ncbi:MAG: hypothetical protein IPJ00_12515 [Saprospirales bacterium]|nr:hypothetical protein [Saprospirales bacterium]
MQKIARLLFALFALLALQISPLTAQNYSGPVPIQDFHRHHGYDPIYTFGPVAEGDTLAWIRFRGSVTNGPWYTGSNIMSWITGPVTDQSFPANMVFRTGDRMRLTIRDNGNVGVNTFLPEQLFTVSHPDLPVIRFDRSNGGEMDFELYNGAGGNLFFRGGADGFGPGLSNFMVITSAGRVGIGTDAPDYELHTVGNTHTSGDFYGRLHIDDHSAGPEDGPDTYIDEAYFELKQRATLNVTDGIGDLGGLLTLGPGLTSHDHQLFFAENGIFHRHDPGNDAAWSSDWEKLLTPQDLADMGTENFLAKFTADGLGDSQLFDDGTTVGIKTSTPDTNYDLDINGNTKAGGNLDVTGQGHFDGKVTIGTTFTDGDHSLYVAGSAIAEELFIKLESAWPDYVFENEYQLKDLSEVESFIGENGHLPGMTPAAQIQTEGLTLGESAMQQQEKIEELFLYVIELNKKVEKLEMENAELKKKLKGKK